MCKSCPVPSSAMTETDIFRKMEQHRRAVASLAKQLPDQKRIEVEALHSDLHRLRGRFMQIATTQEWQLD